MQQGQDPSPYAELRVSDGRAESRTRTRELTRDPIWDEVLPLVISDPQKAALQISVCGFRLQLFNVRATTLAMRTVRTECGI